MLWELLDKCSMIISIIVSIPVMLSWWILFTQKKRMKLLLKSMESTPGNRPVAALIDFGPGDGENQVKIFLKTNNMDMDLLKYSANELRRETLQDFVNELHKLKANAMQKGCDKLHLFYRGPIVGALITGEVLSNTSVNIYHFDKATGTYESWGPLHRSFL